MENKKDYFKPSINLITINDSNVIKTSSFDNEEPYEDIEGDI